MIQAARIQPAVGSPLATSPGVVNIPTPMMFPITSKMQVKSPSSRFNSTVIYDSVGRVMEQKDCLGLR